MKARLSPHKLTAQGLWSTRQATTCRSGHGRRETLLAGSESGPSRDQRSEPESGEPPTR